MFALLEYKHDIMAGILSKAKYHAREFELKPGDCLFVYTDGVTEAQDMKEIMFGEKRLERALNEDADADPEEMIRRMQNVLNQFSGGASQFDDITMMCMKYLGAQDGKPTAPAGCKNGRE